MGDSLIIHRGYKYRAYPTAAQQQLRARAFGAARFVYNHFLDLRREHYKARGQGLSYDDTAKLLTALKREAQYAWLKQPNALLHVACNTTDTLIPRKIFATQENVPPVVWECPSAMAGTPLESV